MKRLSKHFTAHECRFIRINYDMYKEYEYYTGRKRVRVWGKKYARTTRFFCIVDLSDYKEYCYTAKNEEDNAIDIIIKDILNEN